MIIIIKYFKKYGINNRLLSSVYEVINLPYILSVISYCKIHAYNICFYSNNLHIIIFGYI